MSFIGERIDFQDDLFNKQAVIIKRSLVYLYKLVIYSLLLIVLITVLFYINFLTEFSLIVYTTLIALLIIAQFILIIRYIFVFKKNFKVYYLFSDKDRLIENRKIFKNSMKFLFSIFLLVIIFVFINIYISFWDLWFLLWIPSVFINIIIIYLQYLILKRLFQFELDLIVFDDYWIRKFVNDNIRFVSPYYLSKLEIWNISVSNTWIINSIFETGTITITSNELTKRHFEYISHPDNIYKIIKTLVKSSKKDKVNYIVRE